MYNAANDKLWLFDDDLGLWTGGHSPGTDTTMENGQAYVKCNLSAAQGSENTVTVKWAIKFKPGYTGTKKTGLKCKDTEGARSKGEWKGTWTLY
jgi:hypothetical protein